MWLFSPSLSAQDVGGQKIVLSGGPMIEMNVTGFSHSGFTDGNSLMKVGFSAGGFVNLGISKHFSVQGELSFQYRHSEFEWEHKGGCYRYWGVEIPLYAMSRYTFTNSGSILVGGGPYANFGFGASFDTVDGKIDLYEKDKETGLLPMKDSDAGFGVKVGYEFPCGLQLTESFKASVTNVLDTNGGKVKMRPMYISAGVAYRFGKK